MPLHGWPASDACSVPISCAALAWVSPSEQKFDSEIKELTSSGKLSASKIKAVTDSAIANISVRPPSSPLSLFLAFAMLMLSVLT